MTPPRLLQELFRDSGTARVRPTLLDGTPVSIATKAGRRFFTSSGKNDTLRHNIQRRVILRPGEPKLIGTFNQKAHGQAQENNPVWSQPC